MGGHGTNGAATDRRKPQLRHYSFDEGALPRERMHVNRHI
jgi:hypothetical protein